MRREKLKKRNNEIVKIKNEKKENQIRDLRIENGIRENHERITKVKVIMGDEEEKLFCYPLDFLF